MTDVRVKEEDVLLIWLIGLLSFAGTVFLRMSLAVLERFFLALLGDGAVTCISVESWLLDTSNTSSAELGLSPFSSWEWKFGAGTSVRVDGVTGSGDIT